MRYSLKVFVVDMKVVEGKKSRERSMRQADVISDYCNIDQYILLPTVMDTLSEVIRSKTEWRR